MASSKLFVAISCNNPSRLSTLLQEKDVIINVIDNKGRTPLHLAVKHKNPQMVLSLVHHVDRDHIINISDNNGYSALHTAIHENCDDQIISALLEAGANIHIRDLKGRTPLIHAAFGGYIKIVQTLLQAGAKWNTFDSLGHHALYHAIWKGHEDCANAIIKHADDNIILNYTSSTGHKTSIMRTIFKSTPAMMRMIVSSPTIRKMLVGSDHLALRERIHTDEDTILFIKMAIIVNDHGILVHCRNSGLDVMQLPAQHRDSILQSTIEHRNIFLMKQFLNKGCDPNFILDNKDSLLHIAVNTESNDIAELLLHHNATIHVVNKNGVTPLHLAIKQSSIELVRLVLNHDTDKEAVNVRTPSGWIPLHSALIKYKNYHIAKILIDHGADVNEAYDNTSLLFTALTNGDFSMSWFLIECGAKVLQGEVLTNPILTRSSTTHETILHIAARNGRDDILELLLTHGFNEQFHNACGYSPLHVAIYYGHHDAAKVLLQAGAPVDSLSEQGVTPLHLAAWHGDIIAVKLLHKFNANIRSKSSYDRMAIEFAVLNGHPKCSYVIEQLGGGLNAVDYNGPYSFSDIIGFLSSAPQYNVQYEQ